jgi:hypothetical protein
MSTVKKNLLSKATIRNARLCSEVENFGHNTIFNREREDYGWDVVSNGTLYGVSSGFFFMSATDQEPALSRSTDFSHIDASKYIDIVIKYKYVRNREDSIADLGKVQFATSSDPSFNDDKSQEFTVIPDGKWHTYTIGMGPVSTWIGNITNLKIFFASNGRKGDEIFLEFVRVQGRNFEFCSDSCFSDSSEVRLSDSFDTEVVGSSPQGWSIVDSSPTKPVQVAVDPNNLSNNVLLLDNTLGLSSGPKTVANVNTQVITGFFSCRARVSASGARIVLVKDINSEQAILDIKFDTDGFIKYREGASYFNFQEPVEYVAGLWYDVLISFDGGSLGFDISVNGRLVGSGLPYVFSGNVVGVVFENLGTSVNSFYLDDVVLVETVESGFCPGLGKQGSATGMPVAFSKLDIVEGVNDSLTVNLNSYGDVSVTLNPMESATLFDIRDELQAQLSALSIGGYLNCEVLVVAGTKLQIKSGTYSFSSTVEIGNWDSSTLAEDLGFYSDGLPVYETDPGRDHSAGFSFTNSFRAGTLSLHKLKITKEGDYPLTHNPRLYTVEVGSKQAGTVSRSVTINGSNKTVIDFYNRATNAGTIKHIFFHGRVPTTVGQKAAGSQGQSLGYRFLTLLPDLTRDYNVVGGDVLVIDEPGYAGNGEYVIKRVIGRSGEVEIDGDISLPVGTQLNFTIHNVPKIKQFRLAHDGSLTLVNEVSVGLEESGLLYTASHDVYRIDVDWYVEPGDMLGIYNANEIFAGNDPNGSPDALYLEESGDLRGSGIFTNLPKGQGIKGIGLYGRSDDYQSRAVYDIELDAIQSVDYVEIRAKQETEEREYNLCAAVGQGLSVSVEVSGTHIDHVERTTDGTPLALEDDNQAFNVAALTDGIQFAENGLLVNFEQNDADAVYFYINGDAEFADTIEYPDTGIYVYEFTSDYASDPFDISLSWNVPKTIKKWKMFFKEYPNADGYFLEYLKDLRGTFDGSSAGFEKIGEGNDVEFTEVSLDKTVLKREFVSDSSIFSRKFQTDFIAYATSDNVGGAAAMQQFSRTPYTVLEKEFDPVSTTAFNWRCTYHRSTKISEIELISSTDTDSDLLDALEFYYSIDGESFQQVTGELSESGTLQYKVGFPTRYLRVVVNPTNSLSLDSIYAAPADDNIRYFDSSEKPTTAVNVQVEKGQESPPELITIKNNLCDTADLYIDVETEETADSILLKSSMNSRQEVLNPEIGPDGFILLDPDFDLPVTQNVAINAEVYGLRNVAEFKRYYTADEFVNESDYFLSIVDSSKWDANHNNFPQPTIQQGPFPGFTVSAFPAPTAGEPDSSLRAQLISKWKTLGSFNAFVQGSYDARGSNTSNMGSFIGIRDSSGRQIIIRKRRVLYVGGFTGVRSWADYDIVDSDVGTLATVRVMCEGLCGTQFGDSNDHLTPYFINVQRVKDTGIDVLRLSYLDSLNGSGSYEWDGQDYYEIDLSALATPLIGDVKITIGNNWSKSSLFETGTPGPQGTFVKIHNFSFGGSSTFTGSSIKFGGYSLTGISGSLVEDNRSDSDPTKFVAVDLSKPYVLDIFSNYTNVGNSLWSTLTAQYSNSNVEDVNLVEWGNSNSSDCRWILFQTETTSGTDPNPSYLDHLRVYPDITRNAPSETYTAEWQQLGNVLTDGDLNTYLTQIDYPIIAIRLDNQFDLSTYSLVDRQGKEFKGTNVVFNGWGSRADISTSSGITDNPRLVTWETWAGYNDSVKTPKPLKWFAFKNELFDETLGTASTPYYAAEFSATTVGTSSGVSGETNDRVDFTEYASWFDVSNYESEIISILEFDQISASGLLFGSSNITRAYGSLDATEDLGAGFNAFDGNEYTKLPLTDLPAHVWRVFGELVTTTGISTISVSGSGSEAQINVVETEGLFVDAEVVDIDGFQISLDVDSPGIPNELEFQVLSGTDPLLDGSWQTIFSAEGLATTVTGSEGDVLQDVPRSESITKTVFNGGEPFVVGFEDTVSASGVRLLITDAVYDNVDIPSISITKLDVLSASGTGISPVTLSNDFSVRAGGRRSLRITYAAGNSGSVKITAGGSFILDPDDRWSLQDFLSFYLKIDNPGLLDFSNSYIRIGADSGTRYSWNLQSLQGTANSVELKQHLLRFLDADEKALGSIDLTFPDREQLESNVDFISGPLEFFEIELSPVGTASEDIILWFDNFTIKRENFTLPGRHSNTLYLNNSELVYYPMSGFDMRRGYFEAVITPDWGSSGRTTLRVEEVFTIFTAVNEFGESLSLFYDVRSGLMLTAGSKDTRTQMQIGFLQRLQQYKPIKLGIAWDSEGTRIDARSGATVRIYIDDIAVGDFIHPWKVTASKSTFFFVGSRVYQTDVAFNPLQTYPTIFSHKIVPKTASLTGGIENVLISSEPSQTSYDISETLRDKIFISLDGVTYYAGTDSVLPLVVTDVTQGDEVQVWVKTLLPVNSKNLSRVAFLTSRWKVV